MSDKKPPTPQTTALLAAEICAIIEVCGKAGVRSLQYQGLRLNFGQIDKAQAIEQVPITQEQIEKQAAQASALQTKDEFKAKDEFLADLQLTDPVKYEQMIRDDELEELADGDDDEDSETN